MAKKTDEDDESEEDTSKEDAPDAPITRKELRKSWGMWKCPGCGHTHKPRAKPKKVKKKCPDCDAWMKLKPPM